MTDADLRRKDDLALASIDKRLALQEQATTTYAQLGDARWTTVEASIRSLDSKLDTLTAAMSEASATPAGRSLLADLSDLNGKITTVDERVDDHATFIAEVSGALRLARFALGTSFLSVVGNIILGIILVNRP